MSSRNRSTSQFESAQDLLKLLGSGSIAVTGAAALFTTVYLAGLDPVDRLETWRERLELALISVTWQVTWLLLMIAGLLATQLFQRRHCRSPWPAPAALATWTASNVLALLATLLGLDGLALRIGPAAPCEVYWVPAIAVLFNVGAYFGLRVANRRVFDKAENLVLVGMIASAAWMSAGAWSKAHQDLARAATDHVRLMKGSLNRCVVLMLADDRMVTYFDGGKVKYLERTRGDGPLVAGPCTAH